MEAGCGACVVCWYLGLVHPEHCMRCSLVRPAIRGKHTVVCWYAARTSVL